MNPESAARLHKRNALARAEGDRELSRLARDRSSAGELRARELGAVRHDLVDMKASQVVYERNRLAAQESRRAASKQAARAALDSNLRSLVSRMLGGGDASGGDGAVASAAASSFAAGSSSSSVDDDPFHLRAIVDIDCGLDPEPRRSSAAAAALPPSMLQLSPPSSSSSARQARRVLRGAALYKHLLAQMGQQHQQLRTRWILPGRSSFHSLKEYFEEEKQAVARQWQPSERRQAQVRRALEGSPPPFLVDRGKTLPEIYSDFAQHRLRSSHPGSGGSKGCAGGGPRLG